MIAPPDTFRNLIGILGGVSLFAEKIGVGAFAAKKMRDRNSIAVRYWPAVIAVSEADGIALTTDDLVRMATVEKDRAA
jgi:hypothetical protein